MAWKFFHLKTYHPMSRDLLQLIINILHLSTAPIVSVEFLDDINDDETALLGVGMMLKKRLNAEYLKLRRISEDYALAMKALDEDSSVFRGVDDEVILGVEVLDLPIGWEEQVKGVLTTLAARLLKAVHDCFEDIFHSKCIPRGSRFFIKNAHYYSFNDYKELYSLNCRFLYENKDPAPFTLDGIAEAAKSFENDSHFIDPIFLESRKAFLRSFDSSFASFCSYADKIERRWSVFGSLLQHEEIKELTYACDWEKLMKTLIKKTKDRSTMVIVGDEAKMLETDVTEWMNDPDVCRFKRYVEMLDTDEALGLPSRAFILSHLYLLRAYIKAECQ